MHQLTQAMLNSQIHQMDLKDLAKVYPELERFQAVRRRLDPANVFYTQRLAYLFG